MHPVSRLVLVLDLGEGSVDIIFVDILSTVVEMLDTHVSSVDVLNNIVIYFFELILRVN
jgi:hypothetical protein